MGKVLSLVCLFIALAVPRAEALTYYFSESNAFGSWSGTIPPGYGYVDVTKGADDWIYFEVGANTTYFEGMEPGLTWDRFYFNFRDTALDASKIFVDESGTWRVVTDQNVSSFGLFDFGVTGSGIGSDGNDPLRFRIEDTAFDIANFTLANEEGWLFAGHLRRFDDVDGQSSNFLAVGTSPAPVPEPATILLLGAGLGGLALRRRKTA